MITSVLMFRPYITIYQQVGQTDGILADPDCDELIVEKRFPSEFQAEMWKGMFDQDIFKDSLVTVEFWRRRFWRRRVWRRRFWRIPVRQEGSWKAGKSSQINLMF